MWVEEKNRWANEGRINVNSPTLCSEKTAGLGGLPEEKNEFQKGGAF